MNCACKVYETCLKSVMQGPISGMQQRNLDDAAKTMYEARGKGKWSYKDAYEFLSAHQCWKILQDQHPDTLARNVRMNQTSNSSPRTSTPATPDTPVSSNMHHSRYGDPQYNVVLRSNPLLRGNEPHQKTGSNEVSLKGRTTLHDTLVEPNNGFQDTTRIHQMGIAGVLFYD
ncbi:hypothetical protein GIB67_022576 [Kingdonia uniflora]|uniref:Uncharacterized protein n=1 Tax=Kingdonia uniflora TaxID=39325 RepID=A0A7J7L7I7_9MAGN|nr:hypothetical protein GIB67_022576 [Kingdonia uniflora]